MKSQPLTIPELIAHRGYAAAYPENTMPALAAAVDLGARYLECDVQLSQDLVPMLFHDQTLVRQCGRGGAIQDYPLARLREFSAGCPARFGPRFSGVRIATLAELVELLLRHPEVIPFIELKSNSILHFGLDKMLTIVLRELAELRERAVLICYEIDALLAARARGWPMVGAVVDSWLATGTPELSGLAPDYLFCAVAGLPAAGGVTVPGARLAVFEVAEAELACRLAARGVELIETFAYAEMRNELRKMAGSCAPSTT
jgi:glycerophosphoryl diester phosphodiesterase